MFAPSSVRSRFSSSTLRLKGRESTSSPSPVTASSRKISYDVPSDVQRALGAEAVLAGHCSPSPRLRGRLPHPAAGTRPAGRKVALTTANILISRYMTARAPASSPVPGSAAPRPAAPRTRRGASSGTGRRRAAGPAGSRARRRSRRRGPARPGRRRRRRPREAVRAATCSTTARLAPLAGRVEHDQVDADRVRRREQPRSTPPRTHGSRSGTLRAACRMADPVALDRDDRAGRADRVGEERREQPDAGVEVERRSPGCGSSPPGRCRRAGRARRDAPARSPSAGDLEAARPRATE